MPTQPRFRSWVAALTAVALLLAAAAAPAAEVAANLVTNSGFEGDPPGANPVGYALWRADEKGACGVDAEVGYRSRQSLRVAGAANLAWQYSIDVLPGERYLVESVCRQEGLGLPAMAVYWKDAGRSWNWPAGITRETYKPFERAWRKAIARVQVPAEGVAQLTVLLGVEKQESAADVVWFDDVSVTKLPDEKKAPVYPNDIRPFLPPPLLPGDYSLGRSQRETLETLRMGVFKYADISADDADAQIRQMRDSGFNAVLTEGQRFLLADSPDHPPLPDIQNGSLVYPDLVRSTKVVADACHRHGLNVYLHLTANSVPDPFLTEHPEWLAVSVKDGKPSRIWGLLWACLNNPAFAAVWYERLGNLVKETAADGLMVDETTQLMDLCGCAWCRAKFKTDTGHAMPETGSWLDDPESPVRRAFLAWRLENGMQVTRKIRQILQSRTPDGVLLGYYAMPYYERAWASHGCSIDTVGSLCDTLGLEVITDYHTYWPLLIANLKLVRAVGEHGSGSIFFIKGFADYGDIYYWWLMQLSQGAHQYWTNYVPDACKRDRVPLVQWEMKYENYLAGLRSAAGTAVLISTRSNNLIRNPSGQINRQNSYFAVCSTLMLANIPYKTIVDNDLHTSDLGSLATTIIMMNVGIITDAAVRAIRQFVLDGGTLIASAETSLYDEQGAPRPDFALADLFGCHFRQRARGGGVLVMGREHPLLGNVVGEIEHPDDILLVDASASAAVLGYLRVPGTPDTPGLLLNRVGKGKVIYVAGHPETSIYTTELNGNTIVPRDLHAAPRDPRMVALFCSMVKGAANPMASVENVPPGVVVETYTHRYKGAEGLEVHLLNLTGMMSAGLAEAGRITFPDVRERLPEPGKPIQITVRGKEVRSAFVLSPDFDGLFAVPLESAGDGITCRLPSFGRYLILYFGTGDPAALRQLSSVPFCTGQPVLKPIEMPR